MPDTGYDIPWGRWQPALPKPTPANVAASSIWERASSSRGSWTALTMLRETISTARTAHTSLMGLEPWYEGRIEGFSGASRSWKGIAV